MQELSKQIFGDQILESYWGNGTKSPLVYFRDLGELSGSKFIGWIQIDKNVETAFSWALVKYSYTFTNCVGVFFYPDFSMDGL